MKRVWELARLLSRRGFGRQGRALFKARVHAATDADWEQHLCHSGKDGGCFGLVADLQGFRQPPPGLGSAYHPAWDDWTWAQHELECFKLWAQKFKVSTSWVSWSWPDELISVLFRPGWKLRDKHRRGLGADADVDRVPWFTRSFTAVLAKVHQCGQTPIVWHRGVGARLDMDSGKPGALDERLEVMLCGVGRTF
ncbi:unnamed protein product [Prorocentrum cordatum]|uniref:Uncharacterized protein n=1 Tax=Prorocentrum cordatum TaxID=2364126 RepID=A0ABN9U225_9DINO|nr:unnamed protein product [Polarella glacialis]